MDLFLFFLNGGLSFWGNAITCWSIVYMTYKNWPAKQIIFTYICMLIISISYWSNLLYTKSFNEELFYHVLGHIICFIFGGILLYAYSKQKKKDDN